MKKPNLKKLLNKSELNLKRFTITFLACLSLIFIIFQTPKVDAANDLTKFNSDLQNYNVKLQILNSSKETIANFNVALADNNEKRSYGLMHLKTLPQNNGMLFLFENSKPINMWMKNTLISLDMIFIDHDNKISHIHTNASPLSSKIISSRVRVDKVLEINAGLVKRFGIKVGQEIQIQKN